ncbi:hypothetical protein [Nostoc sp.]
MTQHLQFSKRLLLFVTPLLASSVVATSPSQAATFALSEGQLVFTNFSQSPWGTFTDTHTNTGAIFQGGNVKASADAQATFKVLSPEALNSSLSLAEGMNNDYLGLAETQAKLIGNFSIGAGKSFYFDFTTLGNLKTSINDSSKEEAKANGDIFWAFIDKDHNNKTLDFFNIKGNLFTENDGDFLKINQSKNVAITNQRIKSNFGGKEEFATVLVEGFLKRVFANTTNLALVEVNTSQVVVKAPEPSVNVALLISSGVIGIVLKRKRKVNISTCSLK